MTKEQEEINKFLTEVITGKIYKERPAFSNFQTWEGFGKLWQWARKQEWWESGKPLGTKYIEQRMIDPEDFAKAVADFLRKK